MKSLRWDVFHKSMCVINFSPWLIIDSIIYLLNILAQAASVLVGGINIGERLIGGKRVC